MPATMPRYTLNDFSNITFNGFDIQLPDETIRIITDLALQVGSPTYIKTPTFLKVDPALRPSMKTSMQQQQPSDFKRKKKNGKIMESVNDADWETIRTFQATKIEQKAGLDAQIDMIRSSLNKMSEKNYKDQKMNISEILNQLISESTSESEMMKVGNAIFEIASNNRFYSKLYADLYTDLIQNFSVMKTIFENNLNTFLEIFVHIEQANADEDYDKFCKVNKDNERRKSLSSFFVNLTNNGVIRLETMIELTCTLLRRVASCIQEENKKSEVDEMIENIALLYNKTWFDACAETYENGETFIEVIQRLAKSKAKSYPSLSNKSIFKCMDLVEI